MNSPRAKKLLLAATLVAPIVIGGFVVQERTAQSGVRLFQQVVAIVNDRFVDSLSVGALYEKAARGLVTELKDPYAELYTPKDLDMFNQNTGGFYGGVGMTIVSQEGLITVEKVFPARRQNVPASASVTKSSASTPRMFADGESNRSPQS